MAKQRIYYIDNLRWSLTVLVLFHHSAVTYGPLGSWYYYQRTGGTLSSTLLALFVIVNQFFFMGLFFFISGYFSPASIEKKGTKRFILDRVVKLGIPIVVYILFISPLVNFIATGGSISFTSLFVSNLTVLDAGPLWFIETLLVFDILLAILLKRFPGVFLHKEVSITKKSISYCVVFLSITTVLAMLFFPMGSTTAGFQLAYFPQYILLFYLGVLLSNSTLLEKVKRIHMKKILAVICLGIILIPVVIVINGTADFYKLEGGFHFQILIVGILSAIMCISTILLLLKFYGERMNFSNRITAFLSRNAYYVYILHPIFLVFLSVQLFSSRLPVSIKFLIVGGVGTVLSFLLAEVLNSFGRLTFNLTRKGIPQESGKDTYVAQPY